MRCVYPEKLAFSDIHIFHLGLCTWNKVKVATGLHMERYFFNSFVAGTRHSPDHKLYVFGGFDENNFAGNNVNRLELLEDEARYVRNLKEDMSYADMCREIQKRKRIAEHENSRDNYHDILEMVNKKQKLQEQAAKEASEKATKKNPKAPFAASSLGQQEVFRGFSALPDPFLDEMNSKLLRVGKRAPVLS